MIPTATREELEAALELAALDVLYFGLRGEVVQPSVLCNDFFAPAADGEDIDWRELPELLVRVRRDGEMAGLHWVAEKRGISCEHWRKKRE